MRRMAIGAVVVLLLAGCDSSADPGDGESTSPTPPPARSPVPAASTAQQATEAQLRAVCDTLDKTVKLPGDGTVQYTATFDYAKLATNAPMCDIEPDGEYRDVATKASVFGRAEFDYGRYSDEDIRKVRYPKYTPETAEDLLTLDQADPLTDELPCANEPCKDGIHGYQYNFRFETVTGDISVRARFDYITTDVKGDKKPQYRAQAVEAFKASMEVITAGLA
ncbi:hypothetical protein [Actinoplanes sichuanensis]|uniref:DUF3558 domain-containing protein n=1 Tax=Actinoplanes sichuanensis TaxID=512349 RepID=A0ABW4AND4_9ACTN|nr:hypothetical protein [Actinoplanes sichuanensis]